MKIVKFGRIISAALVFGAMIGGSLTSAGAQDLGCSSVQWIVPFTPGGSVDIVSRRVAQRLSVKLNNTPVTVENKAGASGAIGSQYVKQAKADGCTIMTISSSLVVNQVIRGTETYDLEKDFEPVTQLLSSPYVIAAHPSLKANNVEELIAEAKANPGKLSYGTSGATTIQALIADLLKAKADIEMVAAAYKGGSETYVDLLSGRINFIFTFVSLAESYVKEGQLKFLGVTSKERLAVLPDVQAISEIYPDFVVETRYGVLAPKGTPKDKIELLNQTIRDIMKEPEVVEAMAKEHLDVVTTTPEEYGAVISKELRDLEAMAALSKS